MFNYLKIFFMSNKSKVTNKSNEIFRVVITVVIAALTALATALGFSSCNVTRVVTNESQYYQRGDTAVMITTKTVESYDAVKKSPKF